MGKPDSEELKTQRHRAHRGTWIVNVAISLSLCRGGRQYSPAVRQLRALVRTSADAVESVRDPFLGVLCASVFRFPGGDRSPHGRVQLVSCRPVASRTETARRFGRCSMLGRFTVRTQQASSRYCQESDRDGVATSLLFAVFASFFRLRQFA